MNRCRLEWSRISERINKICLMGKNFLPLLMNPNNNTHSTTKNIFNESKEIEATISTFLDNWRTQLSNEVVTKIEDFLNDSRRFTSTNIERSSDSSFIKENLHLLIILESLDSAMTYFFGDTQANIRKQTRLAFCHLQRAIVANECYKVEWSGGWDSQGGGRKRKREEYFERLGGSHLLLHRIWGFKVNSTGERTDLVLANQISPLDPLYEAAEGLVLTEWKVIDNENELSQKINEAKEQANRYSVGSLAPLELTNYCYLVMVSKDYLRIDEKVLIDNDIKYEVINIACKPKAPSQH